jgi:hypothetical protein
MQAPRLSLVGVADLAVTRPLGGYIGGSIVSVGQFYDRVPESESIALATDEGDAILFDVTDPLFATYVAYLSPAGGGYIFQNSAVLINLDEEGFDRIRDQRRRAGAEAPQYVLGSIGRSTRGGAVHAASQPTSTTGVGAPARARPVFSFLVPPDSIYSVGYSGGRAVGRDQFDREVRREARAVMADTNGQTAAFNVLDQAFDPNLAERIVLPDGEYDRRIDTPLFTVVLSEEEFETLQNQRSAARRAAASAATTAAPARREEEDVRVTDPESSVFLRNALPQCEVLPPGSPYTTVYDFLDPDVGRDEFEREVPPGRRIALRTGNVTTAYDAEQLLRSTQIVSRDVGAPKSQRRYVVSGVTGKCLIGRDSYVDLWKRAHGLVTVPELPPLVSEDEGTEPPTPDRGPEEEEEAEAPLPPRRGPTVPRPPYTGPSIPAPQPLPADPEALVGLVASDPAALAALVRSPRFLSEVLASTPMRRRLADAIVLLIELRGRMAEVAGDEALLYSTLDAVVDATNAIRDVLARTDTEQFDTDLIYALETSDDWHYVVLLRDSGFDPHPMGIVRAAVRALRARQPDEAFNILATMPLPNRRDYLPLVRAGIVNGFPDFAFWVADDFAAPLDPQDIAALRPIAIQTGNRDLLDRLRQLVP